MFILEYKDGVKPAELSPKAKANMERCANFLVEMIEKYGKEVLEDYEVNLICVEDGIDSSKDSGKLTITVLSAVAEIERENILVQTMEGRKQKAREGKWNGGQAPSGYTLDSKNSMLIVNPEETERDQIREQLRRVVGAISDIEEKISGAYEEKITADELYKVLLSFDRMYYKMTDLEKKRFMREFIDEIELYPERQEDGRILKQLHLGFPVFYEGSEGDTIRLLKQNTVETVVSLSRK